MAKAKTKKPKATTATIDLLILVLDDGEVVCLSTDPTADGFVNRKTDVLDMSEVMAEAVASYSDEGAPVDVYRIQREVPLPIHSVPEQLHMHPEDGPLITPSAPKKRHGK